jgi:hypothetical protein
MNVIDCMAIAPYYLTLFFMPQPEMGPIDPAIPTGDILKGFIQNNIQLDIGNFKIFDVVLQYSNMRPPADSI